MAPTRAKGQRERRECCECGESCPFHGDYSFQVVNRMVYASVIGCQWDFRAIPTGRNLFGPARSFALKRKNHLPIILECEQEATEETEKQFYVDLRFLPLNLVFSLVRSR